MSDSADGHASLEATVSQYDWHQFKSFKGDASTLPAAIREIASASNDEQATRAYWLIDNTAVVQGRLSSSVYPLTVCLLAALDVAGKEARERIVDLLATIGGGYDDHVDSSEVGPVSTRECVQLMAARMDMFEQELYQTGYASYVDVLLMCAIYDKNLQPRVSQAFHHALTLPSCAKIAGEIESSLRDIE